MSALLSTQRFLPIRLLNIEPLHRRRVKLPEDHLIAAVEFLRLPPVVAAPSSFRR